MAFPYYLEDDLVPEKENKKEKAIKVSNRVFSKKASTSANYDYNFNKIAN
jgi:hypothetical protein